MSNVIRRFRFFKVCGFTPISSLLLASEPVMRVAMCALAIAAATCGVWAACDRIANGTSPVYIVSTSVIAVVLICVNAWALLALWKDE